MATVVSCSGGGGRLVAVDTQSAAPMTLSLKYTELQNRIGIIFPAGPQSAPPTVTVNQDATPGLNRTVVHDGGNADPFINAQPDDTITINGLSYLIVLVLDAQTLTIAHSAPPGAGQSLDSITRPFTAQEEVIIRLGIATSVTCAQKVVAQFQKALNTAIYITPFGDDVGMAAIKFIANNRCDNGVDVSGFDVIQHYLDRRLLTTGNKLPCTLAIGSGTFQGFLVGLEVNGTSGDIPVIEGTLRFAVWPA